MKLKTLKKGLYTIRFLNSICQENTQRTGKKNCVLYVKSYLNQLLENHKLVQKNVVTREKGFMINNICNNIQNKWLSGIENQLEETKIKLMKEQEKDIKEIEKLSKLEMKQTNFLGNLDLKNMEDVWTVIK